MRYSAKDEVETWIKLTSSILLIFTAGIVISLSLTDSLPFPGWYFNFLTLPLLLLTICINSTDFSTIKEVATQEKYDLDHLHVHKPGWQHDDDPHIRISLGKFISVGNCPDEIHAKILATTTSPLERLVTIKKQGYWLKSNK